MNIRRRKNLRVIAPCFVVIAIMLGLVAYSPQLYRLLCGATGLGGTTQRANVDTVAVSRRTVTVQFDSNVAPGLPWRFEPEQRAVAVHLGEQKLVYFAAENTSDQPIVMLGGVIGRKAGSVPGYSYSPALKSDGLIWSAENLDHWLSDPQQFIPGVRMPTRVLEATSRRDIIAYLQQESSDQPRPKTAKGSGS